MSEAASDRSRPPPAAIALRDGLLAAYRHVAAGDFPSALAVWRRLREEGHNFPPAAIEEATLLRRLGDAEGAAEVIATARRRFPLDPGLACAHADSAMQAGDFRLAAERYDIVRRRFPEAPDGYVGGTRALRHMWWLSEAADVLAAGLARFADQPRLAVEQARLAAARGDFAAAERHWGEIQARWPELGPRDDDRATPASAAPATLQAMTQSALAAVVDGDLTGAAKLFDRMRTGFPDAEEGFAGGAFVLRRAGRTEEAEAFAETALPRFPRSQWLAAQHAWCAVERHDHAASAERWASIRARFPDEAEAYSIGGLSLLRLDRLDAAERVLAEGLARFPNNAFMLWQHAEAATKRRDFAEAHRRWARAAELYPDMMEVREGAGQARLLEQMEGLDAAEAGTAPAQTAGETGALFLEFESIGQNCEFGLAQRSAGVEPLGLLRWGSTDPARLIAMLDDRLDGVGADAYTRLGFANGEYVLSDPRYFDMHTFIHSSAAEPEKLRQQMMRRLAFLRDKLLDDLETADKIFVYQEAKTTLDDTAILAIHRALRRYGPARLLAVRHPKPGERDGAVSWLADGVMVGLISSLHADPLRARGHFGAWEGMCRAALELSRRPFSGPSA